MLIPDNLSISIQKKKNYVFYARDKKFIHKYFYSLWNGGVCQVKFSFLVMHDHVAKGIYNF